jgi:phasin family protein
MSLKARVIDDTSVTTLQDAGEKLASSAAEKLAQGFTAWQANAPVYGNAKEGLTKAMKTSEEIVSFGQGNLEAAMKSAQIFATGLQDISKHVAASTQASIEDSVATMKAIAGVKSVKDVIELQTSFARTMMEKMVAESGKLTDASLKLTEQAVAPLTARVSLAVEKFSNAA